MSGRARPDEPLADWCELQVENVCTGRAQIRHHRKGRIVPRGLTLADPEHPDNLTLDACCACHDYAHAHSEESYERGWMLRRVS